MGTRSIINKKFTFDSITTVLALFIIGTCGLLINYVIQKNYSAEGLGLFSYVLSIFFVINSIGTLGMNRAMVYFTSFYSNNIFYRNQLITTSIVLVVIWSSILVFVLNAWILLFQENVLSYNQSTYLKIISFAIPFYCFNNVVIAVYNGLRKMKIYSLLRGSRWVALVLILTLLSVNQPLEITFYSFVSSEVIIFIFNIIFILKAKQLTFILNINPLIEILRYIRYVYPSQILVALNENIDVILIENYVSNETLGVYSFSSKVAKSLNLIGNAIQTNFNPIVSSCFKNNTINHLKELCSSLKNISLIVFSFLIVVLIPLYYLFIEFYLEDLAYISSFKYFILQAIAAGLYASFAWSGGIMIMTGNVKANIYRAISKLALIIFLVLSTVIILPLDYGVYIGFTLVMLAQLFVDRFFISKCVGIKIF